MHSLDVIVSRNVKATARAHAHETLDHDRHDRPVADPLYREAFREVCAKGRAYRACYETEHARVLDEDA